MFYKDFHSNTLLDITVNNGELPPLVRTETENEVLSRINNWIDSWQGESDIINVETITKKDPFGSECFYCFRVWIK